MQAFNAQEIKNPVRFRTGFLVVDKVIEISNLELVKDIHEIYYLFENIVIPLLQE